MEKITGGKLGSCGADKLFAGVSPAPSTFVVELKTAGEYERGTVLSFEEDGTYEVLGKGTGKASAILERTAYTEEMNTAIAYRGGHFNRSALIMDEGHTLSAEEENDLRLAGILLSDYGDVTSAEEPSSIAVQSNTATAQSTKSTKSAKAVAE